MKKVVYPGSFDPVTLGHIDIIRRLGKIFDDVTVLVANSDRKSYMFTDSERVSLLKECLFDVSSVKVDSYNGLTTQYAVENEIPLIVRSLRGTGDWDPETTMAQANKKLNPNLETIFITTEPQYAHISSSLVKEIARNSGPLKEFVSPNVETALIEKTKGE